MLTTLRKGDSRREVWVTAVCLLDRYTLPYSTNHKIIGVHQIRVSGSRGILSKFRVKSDLE